MAKITEIDRLANVSWSTVSRVLNNHSYVTDQKREAVLKTIRLLDYVLIGNNYVAAGVIHQARLLKIKIP